MKVTLQSGRELELSQEELKELKTILEKHYFGETIDNVITTVEVAQKPTEGKLFEVKPLAIDQILFKKERKDKRQEKMRRIILEAFEESKKNPEKYSKNFRTMIPQKYWPREKTIADLEEIASKLGDHMANWVEQALEWAQRIANGESWESVCNESDNAKYTRLVAWKNGYYRGIGGYSSFVTIPASHVFDQNLQDTIWLDNKVPLVVDYDEEQSVA